MLNYIDRKQDKFVLIASSIDWKPFECKYDNLIVKDKSRLKIEPNFNILKVEILTNIDDEDLEIDEKLGKIII